MTQPTPASSAGTPSAVTVREASGGDAARVAELFDEYRAFYAQAPAPQRALAFIRERLAKGDSRIFVAEHEGRIEGFAQLYPSLSSLSMGPIWVLNDLYVVPDARGHGIGSLLLERAHRLAEETGAAHMTLSTARDNRAAIDVYLKMGWKADDHFLHMYLPVKDKVNDE